MRIIYQEFLPLYINVVEKDGNKTYQLCKKSSPHRTVKGKILDVTDSPEEAVSMLYEYQRQYLADEIQKLQYKYRVLEGQKKEILKTLYNEE